MRKELSPLRRKDIATGRKLERDHIVKWLRSLDQDTYINRFVPTTLANWIEAGMYETDKDDTNE